VNLEGELEPQPLSARADAGLGKFIALFAAGWFLDFIGLGIMIQLSFHEFGHAVAAWLSGRWAISHPIAAITFWGQERSPIISLLVAGGLVWAAKVAWRRERLGVLVVATVGLLIMADFAFLIPESDVEMWGIFLRSGRRDDSLPAPASAPISGRSRRSTAGIFGATTPCSSWALPRGSSPRACGGDAAGPWSAGVCVRKTPPSPTILWRIWSGWPTRRAAPIKTPIASSTTHHWTTAGMAAGYHGIAAATLLAIVLCAALVAHPRRSLGSLPTTTRPVGPRRSRLINTALLWP